MAHLLTVVYKQRIQAIGVAVETIDFMKEITKQAELKRYGD